MVSDGEWDLRVADGGAWRAAIARRLCWVCGFPFLRQEDAAFVIGPMCAVNRNSAEPPCHEDCAVYSAQACPFLTTPRMTRRDKHLPEGHEEPGGVMIYRNPGVVLVWVTRYNRWHPQDDGQGKQTIDIGEPKRVSWWCEGRPATRAEVLASMDSGLPQLRQIAAAQGPAAMALLESMHDRALELVPS